MTRAIKSVPITLYYGGEEQSEGWYVGIGKVPSYGMDEPVDIFGLCFHRSPDYLTHMSFAMTDRPADLVIKNMVNDKTRSIWFYFDAGTTCTEIKVHRREITRAVIELGLIKPEDVDPSMEEFYEESDK